jgi:hypothetical protein
LANGGNARYYKKHIDPHYQGNGGKLNPTKWLHYMTKRAKAGVSAGHSRDHEREVEEQSGAYFRDLYLYVGCPHMVLDFALPDFMRDNWSHRVKMACTGVSDLPSMLMGLEGTGAGMGFENSPPLHPLHATLFHITPMPRCPS